MGETSYTLKVNFRTSLPLPHYDYQDNAELTIAVAKALKIENLTVDHIELKTVE